MNGQRQLQTYSMRQRRALIKSGLAAGAWLWVGPALANNDELRAAISAFTLGAPMRQGRIVLDISPIVDNGNTVPMTISVESPMTAADHVTDVAVFSERNPRREVVQFKLTPRSGKAVVATRIRLATTQDVVALARMSDGSFWVHTVNVNVSIAACLEALT